MIGEIRGSDLDDPLADGQAWGGGGGESIENVRVDGGCEQEKVEAVSGESRRTDRNGRGILARAGVSAGKEMAMGGEENREDGGEILDG